MRPNVFFSLKRVYPSYLYQSLTLYNSYLSRYSNITNFFQVPRVESIMFRFSGVTLSIEHMIYFASRLRFVNLQRVFYVWTQPYRAKSRRWKRKFAVTSPELLCYTLLTPVQFYSFWQTFLMVYMSHQLQEGFFKSAGATQSLVHWFKKGNMYWEYPIMWCFFSTNLPVHYEVMNYFFKITVSRWRRYTFMQDRDMYRFFNFPVRLFELPRLWQEDPLKFVLYLRRSEKEIRSPSSI